MFTTLQNYTPVIITFITTTFFGVEFSAATISVGVGRGGTPPSEEDGRVIRPTLLPKGGQT